MAYAEQGGPSLADLVTGIASDVSRLFRKEVELAKAEASEKIDGVVGAGRNLATGIVLATGAVGVLLAALVAFGTALLEQMGMATTVAVGVSALVLAVVFGIIAWLVISRGMGELKAENLNMQRTAHSLQRDAATVRESL